MPSAKRPGTSLCISTATSPRRPCVFFTRARVMNSPLLIAFKASGHPQRLKPLVYGVRCGAAEAAPFQNDALSNARSSKRPLFKTPALLKRPSLQSCARLLFDDLERIAFVGSDSCGVQ